jgi:thiamine-phosphate pyrophosphorylase
MNADRRLEPGTNDANESIVINLPKLYPIVDFSSFVESPERMRHALPFAEQLIAGGATIIQFRDKSGDTLRMLSCARELRRITDGRAKLIINDRFDICLAVQAEGVHLGQDDVTPEAARAVLDRVQTKEGERRIVGFSTHTLAQVGEADSMPIDYLAVGPVFATGSKVNPDPVIGLEGVRQARAATAKPLVAIGGITRKNCREVMDAGADAVAVISDLLESPVKAVEEFLRVLG